jgi:rare lipoprotein A (peptidoglycan hydrolase)
MKSPLLMFGLSLAPVFACVTFAQTAEANSSCGSATYYDQGSVTANGESFNPGALTVAHPWLPFGSWVTIVDQDTGRSVSARVNDRGPWAGGHILDMTPVVINVLDPHHTSDIRYVCIHW